jgi:hypothetical protein
MTHYHIEGLWQELPLYFCWAIILKRRTRCVRMKNGCATEPLTNYISLPFCRAIVVNRVGGEMGLQPTKRKAAQRRGCYRTAHGNPTSIDFPDLQHAPMGGECNRKVKGRPTGQYMQEVAGRPLEGASCCACRKTGAPASAPPLKWILSDHPVNGFLVEWV